MKIGIRKRMLGLFIGVICLFVLLIGRLAWVQLVDGARLQELAELNNVNAQLQLRAEQSVNLSYVEQYAQENLGLQKPQNYQIEYINVNKQDLIDNKVTNENKNWFKEILFNIIEFFN